MVEFGKAASCIRRVAAASRRALSTGMRLNTMGVGCKIPVYK